MAQDKKLKINLVFDSHKSTAEGTITKINNHSIHVKVGIDTVMVFDTKTGVAKGARHWVDVNEAMRIWNVVSPPQAKTPQGTTFPKKKKPGTIMTD